MSLIAYSLPADLSAWCSKLCHCICRCVAQHNDNCLYSARAPKKHVLQSHLTSFHRLDTLIDTLLHGQSTQELRIFSTHSCSRHKCTQAYDLQDLREVAVKLHQLSSSWSDVKKASYVKHAVREYKIHRQLRSVFRLVPSIYAFAAWCVILHLAKGCQTGITCYGSSCLGVVALLLCMFMLLHLADVWACHYSPLCPCCSFFCQCCSLPHLGMWHPPL